MPLATATIKHPFMPPDYEGYDPQAELDARRRATNEILRVLPQTIAGAVNEADRLMRATGAERVHTGMVALNLLKMHVMSCNTADVQLYINPGMGKPPMHVRLLFGSNSWRRQRWVHIHGYIWLELRMLVASRKDLIFPFVDIEIVPAPMCGSTTNMHGTMLGFWGGVNRTKLLAAFRERSDNMDESEAENEGGGG